MKCSVSGCLAKHMAKGLCKKHYAKTYDRKRYLERREEFKARALTYEHNNKELVRHKKAEYYRKHADRIKAYGKQYRKLNKEKVRDWKAAGRKRDRIALGSHDYIQLKTLREKQHHRCAVCKIAFAKKYHKDHIVPLFLGGTNFIENIQFLCQTCNTQKNKKDPIVFMQERGFLL